MGGFIALELARHYPELVHSVFATGAHPFGGIYKWLSSRPVTIWILLCLLHSMPDRLYWRLASRYGMARQEALKAEMGKDRAWATVRDNYTSMLDFGWDKVREINVRRAVIAASLHDDIEAKRKMGPLLREGGSEKRRVFVMRNAVHAWNLQFPELFALGIRAWIEGKELPRSSKSYI